MTEAVQILVVDDDKEDHLILEEYFHSAGVTDHIHYVDNGKLAIDFLEGLPDNTPLPKLVILDLNMPIMNGTQTLMQMKQSFRFKHVPVIIFSTSENETEKRKCLSLGAVDYIVKPITYDEGLSMVNKFASFLD